MIEHVIVHSDNVMESDHIPFRHPQGPVPEGHQIFHDILDDSPYILRCEEWEVITALWIIEPLSGDFS